MVLTFGFLLLQIVRLDAGFLGLVFLFLLALSYYNGPARLSADYYLEPRISWWWRVAELRRPVPSMIVSVNVDEQLASTTLT